ALLGARSVMDLGARSPYRHLAVSGTIETADSDAVHELIEAVKTDGAHTPATIDRFGEVLAGLDATHVLLACTELPLIPPPGAGPSLVDVTALLAHELVRSSHS
ncbi:MAG: aspartate/glutamate racemase family protein, partial [Acidimicrobiia bacterium]|nr:aspartate/glutamate racemase family protein [Acidimicrobiia bacterium]